MKSAVRIRRARAADAGGILALEKLFPSDRMSPRSVRHLLRSPAARTWIAESGTIVGALVLLLRRGSGVARIYSLAVAPAARGQGLARSLVLAAESEARRRRCHTVSLEVRAGNRAARALYAGLGYGTAARLPGYYDDGAAGLRLCRRLRTP